MMFVVKGVVNVSGDVGELALVSYQNANGDHNMSFFFNREEVFSDFTLSFSDVLSKLDKRPREIVVHDRNAYIRVTETEFELVDIAIYTKDDKKAEKTTRRNPGESECIRQNALVHNYYIPNIGTCVRAKSHMKQYQMQGINLAMKLAWENPIKYDEVDLFPVDSVYADFEAMTDVVKLDYTIRDFTQPVKPVVDLNYKEDIEDEEDEEYLQDDELEEIIEQYEEETEEDQVEEEEEDEDEIEIDFEEIPRKAKPQPTTKKVPNKKSTTQKGKTSEQPRGKDGKFKKKTDK